MLHKINTAWRILRDSPDPWPHLRLRWRYHRLYRRLARSPEGWFAYRTWPQTRFLADAADPATHFIYTDGHPDTSELTTLAAWLSPGDACLDLGANIGFFTAVFAGRVGPTGQVVSVEAAPDTFSNLRRTLQRLQLAQAHPVHACVGSQPGTALFHTAINPNDSPLQGVRADADRPGDFRAVNVPMERADDIAARVAAGRPIALVKMDVEGSEISALDGCSTLLGSPNPPLFDVEINPAALARSGHHVGQALAYFPSDRFDLAFINYAHGAHPWPRNRLLRLPNRSGAGFPDLGNLIAIPRIGTFAARASRVPAASAVLSAP